MYTSVLNYAETSFHVQFCILQLILAFIKDQNFIPECLIGWTLLTVKGGSWLYFLKDIKWLFSNVCKPFAPSPCAFAPLPPTKGLTA